MVTDTCKLVASVFVLAASIRLQPNSWNSYSYLPNSANPICDAAVVDSIILICVLCSAIHERTCRNVEDDA